MIPSSRKHRCHFTLYFMDKWRNSMGIISCKICVENNNKDSNGMRRVQKGLPCGNSSCYSIAEICVLVRYQYILLFSYIIQFHCVHIAIIFFNMGAYNGSLFPLILGIVRFRLKHSNKKMNQWCLHVHIHSRFKQEKIFCICNSCAYISKHNRLCVYQNSFMIPILSATTWKT